MAAGPHPLHMWNVSTPRTCDTPAAIPSMSPPAARDAFCLTCLAGGQEACHASVGRVGQRDQMPREGHSCVVTPRLKRVVTYGME